MLLAMQNHMALHSHNTLTSIADGSHHSILYSFSAAWGTQHVLLALGIALQQADQTSACAVSRLISPWQLLLVTATTSQEEDHRNGSSHTSRQKLPNMKGMNSTEYHG
jgi:hypothetical protein